MRAIQDSAIADLRRQLEECRAERDAALAREAALAEVMDAINRSPGDLTPVFQAIVEKAHTLCNAAYGSLQLWNGEKFRAVALRGFSGEMSERLQQGYSPYPNMPCRSLVEGERVAHCIDLAQIDDPTARSGVELGGVRTILYVALRKDNTLLGQIVAARREVQAIQGEGDRSRRELRRSGGGRDGERATSNRAARGAGAANRDRRNIAGD